MRRRGAIAALALTIALAGAACTTSGGGGGGGGGGSHNLSPTVVLTASPTSGPAPLSVHFEGGSSVDSDGTIINWFWDFGDGQSAAGVASDHTYAPGTYTAQLLVTDDLGAFGTKSVTIHATNDAPTAAFTVTSTAGAAPLAVTFDASDSHDPDGSIVAWAWDFDTAGSFAGDTATTQVASHTYAPGVYTAKLTVTDDNGATASATTTISVTGAPAAPTGLHLTGSGCCDTYGDFAWTPVPGADAYEVFMDPTVGCIAGTYSDVTNGQTDHGRVQAVGLCLGSQYDAKIRAHANGTWGPYSSNIHFTL